MKAGNIECECGNKIYFETVRDAITCIGCGKEYDVSEYPEKEEKEETPKEGD